ncbi:type II toxin-antitoxin system HipA family toxin [Xylophilus rhododendri]|uniref:Type II toxin-antitoxin system HipA family toxin n=1 Tax=Xylophilus rhododendri TaxID=2697032 RepID=A0A857JCZ0_9BURK|nr:HipA domain-containing protein [Xylophilus rhododendri]QHJ01072.1 type II toxin-antitoxin system HipA family toxin [Xylophilus rhododendri]
MRSLEVHLNERLVGTLNEGQDLWSFRYDPAWRQAPDGFDLSPALARTQVLHEDGGSHRPVQWYFDNLLPEETLREAVSKEARIQGDDAFALLQYLGAESAGSLVLTPPGVSGQRPVSGGELRPLSDEALSQRIRALPRSTLGSGAPKRMSAAGAQHKLLVVLRQGQLFEPVGSEPSTHILKPDHPGQDYPHSVINEYFTMRLAQAVLGDVPAVYRRYVPEPVYLVQRFDRDSDANGPTRRRHIIDACQLLDKPRAFKYRAASLESLAQVVAQCRNRTRTRLRLYGWLVFNLLLGNDDNHLKNLSFVVGPEGLDLSPWYDMLATASYRTPAIVNERADWPRVDLMLPLPGAARFGEVGRSNVLLAGEALGLPRRIGERELDRLRAGIAAAVPATIAAIEAENRLSPQGAAVLGGELRLLRTIQHVVVAEMLRRTAPQG